MSNQQPIAAGAVKTSRRSPWSAYRVALVVIVGLLSCVAVHLKLTYDKAIRDASTVIEALAVTSEQHIGGSLEAVDSLLEELAATVREGRLDDPRFQQSFAARLPSYPEIRHISVAGADAQLLPKTWPEGVLDGKPTDVSDRLYFTAQRDATGPSRLMVGDPVIGHATGERTLHLSRPIRDRDGKFAGIVVAAINPDVYAGFLSSILYDEDGSSGLISLRGHIAARAPNHEQVFGRNIADSDLLRIWAPQKPVGVARLVARTDGIDKLLAYRVMPEFSLMVTAGVSKAKALAGWRRMAWVEIPLSGAFCGLLLYWTRRIRRQNEQLDSEQHQLEDAVAQRSRELEAARALAERRTAQLARINEELKRLTLVASHHLQEPLRSIVSCSQMVLRSVAEPVPQNLAAEVDSICAEGLALKARLGSFESRVAELTQAVDGGGGAEPVLPSLPPPEPPPPRSLTARAVAIVIGAALLAGNAAQMRNDHDAAIEAAENLTGAVVKSIANHLQGSFRRIQSLLGDVVLAAEDGRLHDDGFRDRLLSRLATMPEIRMVSLADANGRLLAETWPPYPQAGGMSVEEREYFREQVKSPRAGQLVVGRPRIGMVEHDRSIQFSLPVLTTNGRFGGLAIASVNPDLYARFLDTVLLDEDGATAVITLSGHMLARAPKHEEKFGIDISTSDLFVRFLPRSPDGIAHLVSKADGNDKLLGYRVIPGFPLVVTSGYSKNKALAEWTIMSSLTSALAVLASVILYLWAHRADRHAHRLWLYRRQLAVEVAVRTAGLAHAHYQAESRSAQMAAANNRLHDLVRMIAADLAMPLAVMSGHIAHLRRLAAGQNEECGRWLNFIVAGDIHLEALLRDYPRFVAALCHQPALAPVQCSAVVERAIALVRHRWDDSQVRFSFGDLPEVLADSGQLEEVFAHLLSNAAAHAGAHRPISVEISASRQEIGWRISVSDDGPGLPPVNSDHLFRAFETAHGRNPDSTGLGLPLCRVIVQSHGGRIWATSRPGKGCTIHFTLPARDGGPEAGQ